MSISEKIFPVACFAILATGADAQSSTPQRISVEALAITERINVDGRLDERAWREAPPITLGYETLPGNNTPARVNTECRVVYDQEHVYFACKADDPNPGSIRAYYTDRDEIIGHDRIGLAVDPFNDRRRAFEFSVSALGVQRDARYDVASGWDGSWDAIWSSAGRIVEDGFIVEVAVPFKSLRFPSTNVPQDWGMFIIRDWPRSDYVEMHSMPIDQGNSCILCQANQLTNMMPRSSAANVELTPTLTTVRTERRTGGTNGSFAVAGDAVEPSAGLTTRWSVTSNLTLNATINPDFSQVEADAAQLDINERFTLSFSERRPFFLEAAEIFSTPERAVFTRTIADPIVGTQLSGKVGSTAIGLLGARDRLTTLLFPANDGSSSTILETDATAVIGRVRRDVGISGTVGGLITARDGAGYHNHVGSIDGFLQPFPAVGVTWQVAHSRTQYPSAVATEFNQPSSEFSGNLAHVRVDYETRNWEWRVATVMVEPQFRSDAGFIRQADYRTVWGSVERVFFNDGNSSWWTKLGLELTVLREVDYDGNLTSRFLVVSGEYDGPAQSELDLDVDIRQLRFAGRLFNTRTFGWDANIQLGATVGLNLEGRLGTTIDFANVRNAHELRLEPSVRLRPGRHWDLEVEHTMQRLSTGGAEIFSAHVSQMRLVYAFSSRAFVRLLGQYRWTDRTPQLYMNPNVTPEDQSLFSQLLFSYRVNPQTALFIGYSDNWEGMTDQSRTTIPLTQTDRTLFVKLGYAWRP